MEKEQKNNQELETLINSTEAINMPKAGEIISGKVIYLGKNEIYLDIEGLTGGLVRGREMVDQTGEYDDLKVGDTVSATVIDTENEKGLIELSFKSASHQKIWQKLNEIKDTKEIVEIKITEANKGGLMATYKNMVGFLPVSQLSKDNYPRVEGGNKSKILEKLREMVGTKIKVNIIDVDEKEEKIIFSEKEVYADDKKEELNQYKEGDIIECKVTGLVDFGVFVEFGDGLEGLIHISELAWQRIEHPRDLFKVGDKVHAQIISIEGDRVTLSTKKLVEDPWKKAAEKYKINDVVKGKVLKVDKFGVFVELDEDIHGLAHISELTEDLQDNPEEKVKIGETYEFKILSIEPDDHRLGLTMKIK